MMKQMDKNNSSLLSFMPLAYKHFPLLLTWLQTPHVKEWYDTDMNWTSVTIAEKYESYVHGYKIHEGIKKPIHAYIIYLDDHPIGYIQYYNAYDFPRDGNMMLETSELPPQLAAIDLYIGEKDYIGKGLGSRIINSFLQEYVWPHFDACFVDPATANRAAIHVYEKAGFRIVKTVAHGTTWMLKEK
jgi:aminoglycoside 6'-N-acetyltransferase